MSIERMPAFVPVPASVSDGLELAAIDGIGLIDLRIPPGDTEGRARAGEALGYVLPARPRTETAAQGSAALWLSIDRWLVLGARASIDRMEGNLRMALAGRCAAVTDVSDGWAGLTLSGPDAETTLLRASVSDLTRLGFAPGLVRFFLLGQVKALLRVREAEVTLVAEIWTPRSYANHAAALLIEAGRSQHDPPLWRSLPPPRV